ncbi:MAG: glycosyltransferase [Methylacidiphilales bacterium]|nr:glycosyltransferase [Candidatus Methylacidiphilales bacterium]
MRILNLMQCTNLGGMEQASLRLMSALMRRGHRCQVLSLNPIGRLGPLLAEAGIDAEGIEYRGKGGWRSIIDLRRRLRAIEADAMIMTGHNLLASLALVDFCRGHRILAIHHYHRGVKPNWQWRLIYQVARRRFDAITFPSEFVRREAEAITPEIRAIAHTVRNPLTVPELADTSARHSARARFALARDVKLVGNAGRLIPGKRFDVFLHTAALVAQRRDDVQFVIAGDGAERERLESLASELGLSGRLHWLGWQSDLSDFYRAIDVLLFNTDWDAFPTTPLEAMSFGIPVIASAVHSGLSEVITDPRYGFLVEAHDIRQLAGAVLSALTADCDEAGIHGRARVSEMMDPDRIALRIETII